MSHLLNSIGLVLDIAGVVMIWFYGLPEPLSLEGRTYLVTGLIDEKEKAKAQRFHRLSKIGLALILGGFLLQFVSNFLTS
jgi:hypothetical protein